jgi:non-specific serine/threonine protein kinase
MAPALLAAEAGDPGEVSLLLPSAEQAPLPSPGVPGASAVAATPTGLSPWRADCLTLGPVVALDVLLAVPTDDARIDATLAWLAAAARLALDLVARGRVLPEVVAVAEDRAQARWSPVLSVEDRGRVALLGAATPPAARAEQRREPVEPAALVRDVLRALVDAAARQALGTRPGVLAPTGRRASSSAAVEPWLAALAALVSGEATFSAPSADLALLGKQLTAWRDSAVVDTGPLRTCFRLTAPVTGGLDRDDRDAGDTRTDDPDGAGDPDGADGTDGSAAATTSDPWRLEFCLQATDDPSLIVDAAEVWEADRTLAFLERTFEQPQERLLADLGRASRLYPELERALHVARPVALDQAGFGVLVPAELRQPARLGAKLRATTESDEGKVARPSLLGAEGIASYRWEVAVGDTTLTEEELRELARLKSPLVRVRGTWVSLQPEELARAIGLLERQRDEGPATAPVGEVVTMGLGLTDAGIGLPVIGADGDGALGALLRGDAAQQMTPMATPEGFDGALRAYQERGLAWLAFLGRTGLGACLADDMGLGKTAQLLALLAAERAGLTRRSKRRPGPTLLVCPTSVVGNWEREAARFTPDLRVLVHHGTQRLKGEAFVSAARAHDLVLTTYPLCVRDRDVLTEVAWGRVALDEAQHVKNSAARQTKAIRALPAAQRVALTGTPVENRLSELWSIMEFCNPGLLGPAKAFRETYAVPIERYGDAEAAARLKRVTQPFVLRRLKTDRSIIDDLPDKLETKEHCALTREQASLYQATVDDMLAQIAEEEGMARRGLVLKTMLRLKQVCNHPAQALADGSRLPGRSGKLERLDELVDDILDAGEKALVFTQFAQMGALLAGHLRERLGRDVAYLHGGTSKKGRDALVAAFESASGPPLFVLSLKAGGTGLNLTAANHVVHYDRWWNPAVEDQATDRAFRIGQRRDVLVRKLISTGTLEEKIDQMIEAKKALAEQVVGSGEGWLTELSTDELRAVISLSGAPAPAGAGAK